MVHIANILGMELCKIAANAEQAAQSPKLAAIGANLAAAGFEGFKGAARAKSAKPWTLQNGNYGFVVLQGDSVDPDKLPFYLASVSVHGWDTRMFRFGSGGGLLQKVNRDTFKAAFKCSMVGYPTSPSEDAPIVLKDIQKRPIGDAEKKSKPGMMVVIKRNGAKKAETAQKRADGTVASLNSDNTVGEVLAAGSFAYVSRGVYVDGSIVQRTTFKTVRDTCNAHMMSDDSRAAYNNLKDKMKAMFTRVLDTPEACAVRMAEAAEGSKWFDASNTSFISTDGTGRYYDLQKQGAVIEM